MPAFTARRQRAVGIYTALFLAMLSACGSSNNTSPGPNNNDGYSGNDQKYPVLRKNIGLDLAQVSSFAVVNSGTGASPVWSGGGTATIFGALQSPGLFALMQNGDVTPVTLVEMSDGTTATNNQAAIAALYATPQWVLITAGGWNIQAPGADGKPVQVNCATIAVHRPDGAMYCAPIGIRSVSGNGDDQQFPVRASQSGSVVFLMSADSLNRNILYKLVAGPTGEPVATLVDAKLHPNWFVVNASGDLLVQSTPAESTQNASIAQILPVDGSDAVTITGAHNEFAIASPATGTDADTFFVVSGGGGGYPFDGTIRVLKKVADKFQETDEKITLADSNCSWLFPLADGEYMICGSNMIPSLARALVDGQVQASPVVRVFAGVTSLISVGGGAIRTGGGVVYLFAQGLNGHFLARHDGLKQENIAVDPALELLSMVATNAGGLDVVAVDNGTNQKVRATVKPGETALTVLSAEGLSLAEVVVFVRMQ